MTPHDLLHLAVRPACSWLAARSGLPLDSDHAHVMLLAIALQETGLRHRRQVRGPARGWWQFEQNGVRGVLRHQASAEHAFMAMGVHLVPTGLSMLQINHLLEHNDALACAFARLLLWTLPQPLPRLDEPEVAWNQYLNAWRPRRPHSETWYAHWNAAVQAVAGAELVA